MRSRPIVPIVPLLAALGAPAAAQELSSKTLPRTNAASRVRVRLAGEGWRALAGAVASPDNSPDGARLYLASGAPGRAPAAVPLSQVAQVQVARGSHAGSGAKIGGAIALGLSLLAIVVASGDEWTAPTGEQAVVATLFTTALGAGSGALVGLTSPRWRTVYGVDPP